MKPAPQFRIRPDSRNPRLYEVQSNCGAGWRAVVAGFPRADVLDYVKPLRLKGIVVEFEERGK